MPEGGAPGAEREARWRAARSWRVPFAAPPKRASYELLVLSSCA